MRRAAAGIPPGGNRRPEPILSRTPTPSPAKPIAAALDEAIEKAGKRQRRHLSRAEAERAAALPPAGADRIEILLRRKAEERAKAHQEKVVEPKRASNRSKVDVYLQQTKGGIDQVQHRAARRFASDWKSSGFAQRVTASYDPAAARRAAVAVPGTGPTAAEYVAACRALGPCLSRLVHDVVVRNHSAQAAAVAQRWPAPDGLPILRAALDTLAVHYGFKAPPAPG
jgi:Domain of unknown function (DUF6456)